MRTVVFNEGPSLQWYRFTPESHDKQFHYTLYPAIFSLYGYVYHVALCDRYEKPIGLYRSTRAVYMRASRSEPSSEPNTPNATCECLLSNTLNLYVYLSGTLFGNFKRTLRNIYDTLCLWPTCLAPSNYLTPPMAKMTATHGGVVPGLMVVPLLAFSASIPLPSVRVPCVLPSRRSPPRIHFTAVQALGRQTGDLVFKSRWGGFTFCFLLFSNFAF